MAFRLTNSVQAVFKQIFMGRIFYNLDAMMEKVLSPFLAVLDLGTLSKCLFDDLKV